MNTKTSKDKRNKDVHIRFSDVEYLALQLHAAAEGLDVSNAVRRLVRKAATTLPTDIDIR